MEPFKNIYNRAFYTRFVEVFSAVVPSFEEESFFDQIFDEAWDNRELKERMRHTTKALHHQLSDDFEKSVSDLLHFILLWEKRGEKVGANDSLAFMFIPDYIELYGLDDFETSMRAMEAITPFTSCEFAVRPFIIKYPEQSISMMTAWAGHDNLHVRRLASEGSRPRLPWAIALPFLKEDPAPILPLLEQLKEDPSQYVRRSVANNLNDIAKDNPDLVLEIAKQWKGQSKETDWIVKHGCRTLLKQGLPEVMQLFGFGKVDKIKIAQFKLDRSSIRVGEQLSFSFLLINQDDAPALIRLEYGIYYQKANGSLSRKVFKISEKEYAPQSSTEISRHQSFKIITTRKLHPGLHRLSIIINGVELAILDFQLVQ